jgi:hypothetical protein
MIFQFIIKMSETIKNHSLIYKKLSFPKKDKPIYKNKASRLKNNNN